MNLLQVYRKQRDAIQDSGKENRKKENRKKGFTLVELIVVLVILAILAAVLVPALLGYIQKAKEKRIILHGSYAYKSAQSVSAEKYGMGAWNEIDATNPSDSRLIEEIITEAEVLAETPADGSISLMTFQSAGLISTTEDAPFKYTEGGLTAVLVDGVWTIEDAAAGGSSGGGFVVNTTVNNNNISQANITSLEDFFSNGWSPMTVTEGVAGVSVKTFSVNGTEYALVLTKDQTNGVGAIKTAITQKYSIENGNIEVQNDGKLTSSFTKTILSSLNIDSGIKMNATINEDGTLTISVG